MKGAAVAVWIVMGLFARTAAQSAVEKAGAPGAPASVDPTLPNVLIIGDSISAGYLPFVRARLAGHANVYRIPTNGGDSGKGRRELAGWLRTGGVARWDVIQFNFGLHDMKAKEGVSVGDIMSDAMRTTPLRVYRDNLDTIAAQLLATNAQVIFVTTTPVPPVKVTPHRDHRDVVAYNAAAREVLSARGIAITDLYESVAPQLATWQRPADVHFTATGSEFLAGPVSAGIRRALPSARAAISAVTVNSLGMRLVPIEPGIFRMGNDGEVDYAQLPKAGSGMPGYRRKGEGRLPLAANSLEWDEAPAHPVRISQALLMAATPVTNRQYEAFRPAHRAERGRQGFSREDDEAVLFVSWHDAVAFCMWLSERERRAYRLPTEAEWEYACRGGTTSAYSTGDSLPPAYQRHQVMDREHTLDPARVSLVVGTTAPNAWGLHDMHGLVEEWCQDWYGPYIADLATDPVGRAAGIARVTRGGSHSTGLPFLRSANRSAALPDTRSYLIGFRVVAGALPTSAPLPAPAPPRWARDVSQQRAPAAPTSPANEQPRFLAPRTYTRVSPEANGPLFSTHNHCPSVTVCPNGDLLAIWFTTVVERGREMVIAAARLRRGRDEWDEPHVFLHVADRNLTGSALWWDGERTLHHFNGVGAGDDYRNLALVMRSSTDNGASWSEPRLIGPAHEARHQVIDTFLRAPDGAWVLACDATHEGAGGSAVHISRDGGLTWNDPGAGQPVPQFAAGGRGAWIAGIHAGLVATRDGSWLALGRGNSIHDRMPMSLSADGGRTWHYSASPFEPIGGAQRLELLRLREGPLLLVSFARRVAQTDAAGESFQGTGMFAALSFDEGKTWPVQKLITPGAPRRVLDAPCNRRWGESFSVLDREHAESRGYLTGVQAADGLIHVLSSGTHYAFNLRWLMAAPMAHERSLTPRAAMENMR